MNDALKNMTLKMSKLVKSRTFTGIFDELTQILKENKSLIIIHDRVNVFNLCVSLYGYKKTGDFKLYDQLIYKVFHSVFLRPLDKGIYRECQACDGGGEINCDYCDGSGYVECDDCGGSGEFADEPCGNCDGEGKVNCDECRNGNVTCHNCDGHGDIFYGDVAKYELFSIVSFDEKLKQNCEYNLDTINPIFKDSSLLSNFEFQDKSLIYNIEDEYGIPENPSIELFKDYTYCCYLEDGIPVEIRVHPGADFIFSNDFYLKTSFYYERYED